MSHYIEFTARHTERTWDNPIHDRKQGRQYHLLTSKDIIKTKTLHLIHSNATQPSECKEKAMVVKYFNPPQDVLEGRIGRKLQDPDAGLRHECFEHYRSQLRMNEHLYMGLSGGYGPLARRVVNVDDSEEYRAFYGQYLSGMYEAANLYALPASAVA